VITVYRDGTSIVLLDAAGKVVRRHDCVTVNRAVALGAKLLSDTRFAAEWGYSGDPEPADTRPHGLERVKLAERG